MNDCYKIILIIIWIINYLIRPLLAVRVIMQMSSFAYWEHGDVESKLICILRTWGRGVLVSRLHSAWCYCSCTVHPWCIVCHVGIPSRTILGSFLWLLYIHSHSLRSNCKQLTQVKFLPLYLWLMRYKLLEPEGNWGMCCKNVCCEIFVVVIPKEGMAGSWKFSISYYTTNPKKCFCFSWIGWYMSMNCMINFWLIIDS